MAASPDPIYGDLPPHWEFLRVIDLCAEGEAELQTGPFGTMLHAHAYREQGTPVVAVKNIADNRITGDGIPRVDEETSTRLDRYRLRSGDILFGRKGAVERRGLITSEQEGWLQGSDCIRLRLVGRKTDACFISYVLGTSQYRGWITQNAHGATMPSLNQEIIGRIPLPIPPVGEQRAIAHVLGTLDDKIELNRRMNQTLEQIARALFKSWFVDFDPVRAKSEGRQPPGLDPETAALFPDSFTDSPIGPIPSGWSVGPLSTLCEVGLGGDWGEDLPFEGAVEVFCLRGVDLEHLRLRGQASPPRRWIKPASLAKRALCANDVLVAASGAGPLGRPLWIAPSLHGLLDKPFIYSNFCKRLTTSSSEHAVYLDRTLHELRLSGEVWEYSTGTSVPNLDIAALLSRFVVIPSQPVIERFRAIVGAVIDRLYLRESLTLAAIRDSLLPKLLSGEVRIDAVRCVGLQA